MKKTNYARILVLVLSIALLIGSIMCITSMAAEDSSKGEFVSVSGAYSDKVHIRVMVNATQEEIKNGDVTVTYSFKGETKNATYHSTADNGVWVITEGIAAYDLAEEIVFNSYVGDAQVESNRKYSYAQFIYKMLYTNSGISNEFRTLYESLLTYGKAAQIALNQNADKLVTDSTLAFTNNADISLNGKSFAFAPAASLESLTPVWNGTVPLGKALEGWNIIENGEEKAVGESFSCSGVVEILSPVLADLDPTPFTLQNGGFENGLEGWTLVGNIGNVTSDRNYWVNDAEKPEGFEFGMDGEKMFSAYAEGAYEGAVGTLTSSTFIVGGTGYVTFKVGAMRDGNYVYVDVVDADTKQILARYYNGLWAERTDGVKSGCTLIAYKADLSAFMGKEVFFRISDNADSGYGLFFLDSFNTYYTSEPQGFNVATPVDYAVSGTIYDVFNGGFEMGGNQGWWNVGEPGAVTGADAFFSGVAYGKEGNFLYSGVEDHGAGNGREGNTGVLTSSVFEIGGSGYITYMLGGGNSLCYVQIIDSTTGEILARYRQQAREDAVLKAYVADLTAYVGRSVRIQVVDKAVSDWGCVSFDNVVSYYTSKPEGFIDAVDVKYELVNGSFENGLDGWTMDITQAGTHNTLGWVQDSERAEGWYHTNEGRKDGNNLFTFLTLDGVNCENTKGTLNSSTFVLKKDSYVSFRFGAAGSRDVKIELCRADGSVIATFYNEPADKVDTLMYAYSYQYTGEDAECFFRVVDNAESNYGCFVVDDFRVNLTGKPEGFLDAIQ